MIGLCVHACFVLACILEKAGGEGLGFCLNSSLSTSQGFLRAISVLLKVITLSGLKISHSICFHI